MMFTVIIFLMTISRRNVTLISLHTLMQIYCPDVEKSALQVKLVYSSKTALSSTIKSTWDDPMRLTGCWYPRTNFIYYLSHSNLQKLMWTSCWRWPWTRLPSCRLVTSLTSGGGPSSPERLLLNTTTTSGGSWGEGIGGYDELLGVIVTCPSAVWSPSPSAAWSPSPRAAWSPSPSAAQALRGLRLQVLLGLFLQVPCGLPQFESKNEGWFEPIAHIECDQLVWWLACL